MNTAPPPDLIFYDPFSFKADSELWTLKCFRQLFDICRGRDVELFTYSASTAVRAAFLAAGFEVAVGAGTGPKRETTIALTRGEPQIPGGPTAGRGRELLGRRWLARWERSGARYPSDMTPGERESFEALIRGHSQFRLFPLMSGLKKLPCPEGLHKIQIGQN